MAAGQQRLAVKPSLPFTSRMASSIYLGLIGTEIPICDTVVI